MLPVNLSPSSGEALSCLAFRQDLNEFALVIIRAEQKLQPLLEREDISLEAAEAIEQLSRNLDEQKRLIREALAATSEGGPTDEDA